MFKTLLGTLFFPILYVGPFYMYTSKPRSDPQTIRRRLITTAILTLLSPLPTYLTLCHTRTPSPREDTATATPFQIIIHAMGFRIRGFIPSLIIPLFLTALPYSAALYTVYIMWPYSITRCRRMLPVEQLIFLRNIIAAPITEELMFRGGMVSFLILRGVRPFWAALLSPLVFGMCHLHHLHDMVVHQRKSVQIAVAAVLAQFCISSLFGIFSVFLLLRTGHLMAPILAHSFCNLMGLPFDFEGLATKPQRERQLLINLFLVGCIAFVFLIRPLTSPKLYGGNYADDLLDLYSIRCDGHH